jgi:hypothetical protein
LGFDPTIGESQAKLALKNMVALATIFAFLVALATIFPEAQMHSFRDTFR